MDQTTNLKLPYIAPSQAQKHVTHNEAIRALDALVQLSVMSRKLKTAPPEPSEGDRYIVASEAAIPWAGKDNKIAAWQDGAWAFFEPQEGWHAWVAEEQTFVVFDRNSWSKVTSGANPVALIGINTVADENNRLALRSPASLFDHVGGGHQLKINKVDDNDTASLVFQSDYQGRAEMGTMRGRDFRIRTSADGNQWQNAMVVDSATGIARFPSGIAQSTTGKKQSGLIFLPANDSGTVIFQPLGGVRTQALTTAKLTSISADIMTFTSNTAGEFFGAAMRGLSMVRIWNVTKIPALPAFAKWDTAANQLQVSNSDDIKLWSAGDAIQLGDPVTHLVAIDISPLMQTLLGSAFRQDGLLLEAGDTGSSTLACRDQSPASASNLVYFKFDEVRSFSVIGIYG